MRTPLIIALTVAGSFMSTAALGQSESLVSSARELAKQGLEAYDAGNFADAADKLGKAYQLVPVPTLATNRARALVKLGQWVSASERYLEAIRIAKDNTWQAAQFEAQKDAEKEREELLPRIPRLTVLVKGASPSDVQVSIDGVPFPAAVIGIEQLQDPGAHAVQGKRGNQVVNENVTLKAGDRSSVTLQFNMAPVQLFQAGSESSSGSNQKLIGWIGVGAGGAGLVFGGVTGLLALSKQSSLNGSTECSSSDHNCTSAKKSDVDSYNNMRTFSTVGFIAGGVLTAAGVTLLLTAPKRESAPQVGLWLSPSGASVTGRF